MALYDSKPEVFQEYGDGTLLYNFNINKVEIPNESPDPEALPITMWECDQVNVGVPPITSDIVTEAVMTTLFPSSLEQKLINDYNAAMMGLIGGSKTSPEAKAKIAAYQQFLKKRMELKEQIDEDCATYLHN